MLSVHASIAENADITKDTFYDKVERVFATVPKQNMVLILGDFI